MGILATVIITQIINASANAKLQAARFKVMSDIRYAQSLAVTQQVNHGVIFNPVTEAYSVYRQINSTIVNNPLTLAAFTVNFASDADFRGVGITSTSFGLPTTNQVEFDSLGTPSDGMANLTADGSVTLGFQGTSAVITVTKNTGRVN